MRARLPKVRVTVRGMMVGIAIITLPCGFAYERLVRHQAKEALRHLIEAREATAFFWEDNGRKVGWLRRPERGAIRTEIAWNRRRAHELGRLDPMRVARPTLDKDSRGVINRQCALMYRIDSAIFFLSHEIGNTSPSD